MVTDYNLEVLTRKGYKNGKMDRRGLRYVKLDKCECGNDAKLIWFYEDDCYQDCHACGTELCEKCEIEIDESDYSYLTDSDWYEAGDGYKRIVCPTCYQQMLINKNNKGVNKMKHTQGKWEVVYYENSFPEFSVQSDKYTPEQMENKINSRKVRIASVFTEANAHLIASAPEMLDALKKVHKNMNEHYSDVPSVDVFEVGDLIAKAEGK